MGFKLENDGGGNGSLVLSTRGILPHHSRYFIPVGGTSVWGNGGEGVGEDLCQGCHHFYASTVADTLFLYVFSGMFVNFKVFLADLSTKNMTQNRFSGWVC